MVDSAQLLVVDLSARTYRVESLDEKFLQLYLGGRGLGARLLARYLTGGTDALGESNVLLFSAGALQGTSSPFSSRTVLTTKSPLTGGYLFSVAGGMLGHQLKRCGYWALAILGASQRPVLVRVRDHEVDFVEAAALWGLPVTEALQQVAVAHVARDPGVAVIGPAGENLVRYAAVMTELPRKRSFGRGGAGAVMGAKKLKAVVVAGSGEPPIADREQYRSARRAAARAVASGQHWRTQRRAYGTATSMANLQAKGMLPSRNWQRGSFEGFENICPTSFGGKWNSESHPCAPFCPAPCAKTYHIDSGEYGGVSSEGPDYETIYALGANCGIDRFDAVVKLDRVCDELGLDTISAGGTMAFLMECFERGLLTPGGTGGLELEFGDHRAVEVALGMTATRTGFGDVMAEGIMRCAAFVGQGSEDFAMHSRGLDFGGWGCRAAYGQALQYAISPRGGCHHDLGLPAKVEWNSDDAIEVEGKGDFVRGTAIRRIALDSAIQCSFSEMYFGLDLVAELLAAVTGQQLQPHDLESLGERVLNLERLLNVREGFDRTWDRLPRRLLEEPLPDGPRSGSTVPLEALKDDFYRAVGWDVNTGVPTAETLVRVGLDEEMVKDWSSLLGPR